MPEKNEILRESSNVVEHMKIIRQKCPEMEPLFDQLHD
jgi:hypothetical protein